MSPRAAWRLERFGFIAYDYVAGKVDWMAAGLPTVRADTSERRALDAMQPASATCAPDEAVGDVATLVTLHGSVLVLHDGVLLGRIRARHLNGVHPATPVEKIMEPGPATVRANEPLDALVERMTTKRVEEMIVTAPDGRLLGVVRTNTQIDTS